MGLFVGYDSTLSVSQSQFLRAELPGEEREKYQVTYS